MSNTTTNDTTAAIEAELESIKAEMAAEVPSKPKKKVTTSPSAAIAAAQAAKKAGAKPVTKAPAVKKSPAKKAAAATKTPAKKAPATKKAAPAVKKVATKAVVVEDPSLAEMKKALAVNSIVPEIAEGVEVRTSDSPFAVRFAAPGTPYGIRVTKSTWKTTIRRGRESSDGIITITIPENWPTNTTGKNEGMVDMFGLDVKQAARIKQLVLQHATRNNYRVSNKRGRKNASLWGVISRIQCYGPTK